MPLMDILRLKQDEARARLRSRKRKLSDLYNATLNEDGSQQSDAYHQKLNAFLAANDLERGFAFDESRLPQRPLITTLPQQSQSVQTINHAVVLPNNPTSGKAPAKAASGLSPRLVQSLPSDHIPVPHTPLPTQGGESHVQRDREVFVHEVVDVDGGRQNRSHSNSPSASRRLADGSTNRTSINGTDEPPQLDQENTQGLSVPNERSANTINSPRRGTPDPSSSRAEKSRRSRSPVVLAPVSTVADPQSSPASTDAPGSSNTPGPTAGSPTTSPGDEEPPLKGHQYPKLALTHEDPSSTEKIDVHELGSTGVFSAEDKPLSAANSPAPATQVSTQTGNAGQNIPSHPPVTTPNNSTIRRPPMRIDTQSGIDQYFKPRPVGGIVESPIPMTGSAIVRRTPASVVAEEPSKRATRISSGALQKKSVSEILGETPKTLSPQMESPLTSAARDVFSPSGSQSRLMEKEKREKERSKMSTVVFAKPARTSDVSDTIELVRRAPGDGEQGPPKQRDYLYSLFESRAYSPPKNFSLASLIHEAHKTISTADHIIDYREQMNCRALKRIYQLQNANRWPLRQMKRADEAVRPTSHWDFLLDDAKWMRTDFREERKWKLAAAKGLAEWCAEYVASSKEERILLRVHVSVKSKALEGNPDVLMEDGPGPAFSSAHSTPDLIHSGEDESVCDGIIPDPRELSFTDAPAAIFSLGASDFAFPFDKTPAAEKLLNELPLYEPVAIVLDMSKSDLAQQLDARWKQDIVPISRFAIEKIHLSEPEPPRKRSRYEYTHESSMRRETRPLPPKQTDVALFQPENKHMRDRIHPGHSFRPPSEHPMPTQLFFETRSSSQWTHTEDDELRRLVKGYSYNWSLISSCLTSKSTYTSGADRRTPWECFERWIGLEGLPADMSKTPYFRAYHSRIEAAGRHVQAQWEATQQRASGNMHLNRKHTTKQPVRVERKRTQKHLAMLDAMRKLAKKRETALQKQQHQADLAAMRKANEANQPRPPITTPAQFSQLKHEREVKVAERQELYRQQLIAHQRATAAQQRGPSGQPNGLPNGLPRNMPGLPNGIPPGAMPGLPNSNLAVPPNHQRQHPMPNMPNGMMNGVPVPPGMMGPKTSQAQQMHAQLVSAARTMGSSPESQARMMQEARNIQHQQQQFRQAQAQALAQSNLHSSPNMPNVPVANNAVTNVNNAAYLAQLAAASGAQSPAMGLDGAAGSPRTQNAIGQALSNGHTPIVSQISNQLRAQFPGISQEELMQSTNRHLAAYQALNASAGGQKHRPQNQAALNAAMGAANASAQASTAAALAVAQAQVHAYGQGIMTNEQVQQYNQRMRVHAAQQRANATASGGYPGGPMQGAGGMIGMGSSPVMNMARPVSQQGQQAQMSRSATPREQRSGSSGNVGGMMGVQGSPLNQAQVMAQQGQQ